MKCYICTDGGDLHKIVYGLPADDFDFERFEVGGCVIYENVPSFRCRICGWEGTKNELKSLKRSSRG